ncbi:MAG: TIGR04283 family arsenosugar biosynthesis glycosyltransferase [Alphaproteobacteria bacterium]
MALSIVVPVLNEEPTVERCLRSLADIRARGAEIIVVDGGSADRTVALSVMWADRVVTAPQGRASQMNAGAEIARGDTLLFLHADTLLPPLADRAIETASNQPDRSWGFFKARIIPATPMLSIVAASMNLRSYLSSIATGDQAIFVRRAVFESVGSYPDIPLMEDVALCRALRRAGRPACLDAHVLTSARRWVTHGVFRTIVLMWWLRLRFFLGANPFVLAEQYGYVPRTR